MEKTRQLDIVAHLQDNGFDAYLPGVHKGECTSEYVVVKTGETTQHENFSSTVTYYDIMVYVPEMFPSRVDELLDEVIASMKGLFPMLRPTHSSTGSFFDDTVKAHMRSTTYINYRKL